MPKRNENKMNGRSKYFGGVDYIAAYHTPHGFQRHAKPVGYSRSKYTPHVGKKQTAKAATVKGSIA